MPEYERTKWEYRGTIEQLMHLFRWALVFQELSENENLMDIIRDKAKVQEYALSQGMTLRAIVNEMQIAIEATTEMLDALEKRDAGK